MVIDIGNTLQKVAVFSADGEELLFRQFSCIELADIQSLFYQFPVSRSILSSVGEEKRDIEHFLDKESRYIPFSYQLKLPIRIRYDNPETLGSDRIANAVASYLSYPGTPVLSIQAGSCLVYDCIDENGTYLGGAISPGIEMRFKALQHFTKRLPLLSKSEVSFLIGQSTQQSIESGVINGVKNEIEGFISSYQDQFKGLQVLLSGGDSYYLQKSIKNTIFVGSNFVLKGLHKILTINVEKP